jgi:dihydrofolate reductase
MTTTSFDPASVPVGPLPRVVAIAAMADNRVIGNRGSIPWRISDDFRWFKHVTMGHTLLMGRKTWDSLGRKSLPGRRCVVVTRQSTLPDAECVHDPLEFLATSEGTTFVIGGGDIYRLCLPVCGTVLLTRVPGEPEGDTFFPPFESAFENPRVLHTGRGFEILRYDSKARDEPALDD